MPKLPLPSPELLVVEDLLALLAALHAEAHGHDLPGLIALARKVERVHMDAPDAPLGLADALEKIALDLDMHIQMEEAVLFPAMLGNIDTAIAHPIALMRREHADYAAELDALQALANDFVVPAGACGSWRRLYRDAESLCASLRERIRLENDVLFPRFEVPGHTRSCTQS